MKKSRKYLAIILAVVMMLPMGVSATIDTETMIILSDEGVTVDGKPVSQNAEDAVYLSKKTEVHEDVPEELKGLENSVITITDAGTYRVSGKMTDAQLSVAAGQEDEVVIILDNADITCRTAPAVLIYSAKEPATPGESGVTLYLEEGSVNTVNGSHTTKTETVDVKNDAALSSMVSLTIDGTGALNVISDNEGIEVKYKHLTINNGTIRIDACDDPINGSEDGVAHITINGGNIYGTSERGAEGDGMDSNGYITINGGVIVSLANPKSANSGLDSDFGTTINGGIVVGAGNMYDPLEDTSGQLFMHLQFTESTDDLICITDKDGNPVFAYDFPHSYSYISFSRPELSEGIYHVYIGGEMEGTQENGLYTEMVNYEKGEQMHHGGTAERGDFGGFGGMRPPMGEGMMPPEGMEFPEGMERPQMPEGMEFPEGMERPQMPEGMEPPTDGFGGRGPRGMKSSGENAAFEFLLTNENRSFTNVSTGEIVDGFIDVPEDAWFYNSVTKAAEKGLVKGVGDKRFAPDDNVTAAEWITILGRLAGADTENGEEWYTKAVAWGTENQIMNNGDWTFETEAPLKREQMSDMIWRFAKMQELDMTLSDDLTGFADREEISDYAEEAFSWSVGCGVLQGDEEGLRPADTLTRAEAAEVLEKLSNIIEKEKNVSVYPVSVNKEFYTEFSESTDEYFPDGFKTGFGSGVTFKGYDENGNMQFYGVTDRGPSLDVPTEDGGTLDDAKIFPSPEFTPSIGIITIKDGQAVVENTIKLKNKDGSLMTGLPLPKGELGSTGEVAYDISINELSYDSNGFDPEGIAVDADGNFWLADEYGPYIGKFNTDGVLIEMYEPGNGLPEILKHRIANRGFEGITISPSGKIFATVQSVLDIDGETSKTASFIRIAELNPETGETKMYAYPVDLSEYSSPKNCKIGDVYALDDETLLLVEQGKLTDGTMRNVIYKVNIKEATDISGLTYMDKELEYTRSTDELKTVMSFAEKEVYKDLRELGWTAEKAEGLCLTDKGELAVMIEDDFGLSGAEITEGSEKLTLVPITDGDSAAMWIIK